MTLGVNVHEMQLSTRAIIVDRVVSRGVDVPAGQVDRFVVVGYRRVLSIYSLVVLHRESWTVSPIREVAHRLVGIVESGDVVLRKPIVEAECDWGLFGPGLAKFVL